MQAGFSRPHVALLALALAATAAVAAAAWLATMAAGTRQAQAALDGTLQVLQRSVESEIERFRYLPAVVARDGRIRRALIEGSAGDLAAADDYLLAVRNDAGADALFVLNGSGLTIAASNFAEPTSFVGENYDFRPYFRDALKQGSGRFYAVGVTTGLPGYFLSSAIRDGARVIGIAVVKVDMRGFEAAWRRSDTLAAIADRDGVVFLTGYPPWKYRPLHALDRATLRRIAGIRKYDGIDLAAARPIFASGEPAADGMAEAGLGGRHLMRARRIEPDGWTLWSATSLQPIRDNADLVGLLAALAGLLASGVGLYVRQRRQLLRTKLEAHGLLEQRVAERTAELAREIDERRRAEADLRDAQATLIHTAKLAALGRMSAAIAHEVSQPLAAMENTLATTALLADRGDTARVLAKVASARTLVRRIQRTVKHLKAFARNEPSRREPVNVGRCIAAALELAAHRAQAAGIAVAVAADRHLAATANAMRLEQVILNLLVNALDAVEGRSAPEVRVAALQCGDHVEIQVADNGRGISDALRDRIAEPFFTTKETGEGLGLGLSISRAILEDLGGSLRFTSREGEGSIFTIALPVAQAGATGSAGLEAVGPEVAR